MPTGDAPLGGYIVALYNFLLGAIGIIAMMMLVFGGFRYMTSAGNPAAMGDAKDIFYSAVIGLALALISYLIISAINPELLFTQDAKLVPAGSPEYSTNLPPRSCSYNLSGFEPDHCRCIGDVDGEGGDTTCEFNKSDYDDYYDGWCDKVVLNCGSPIIGTDVGCMCGTTEVKDGDVGNYCCAGTNTLYSPDPPPFLNANETCLAACAGHDIDTNTCSGMCKSIFCPTKPKCCIKVDLRVGTSINDVSSKEVKINVGGTVFFDTLTYSYNCSNYITGAVMVDAERSFWSFGQFFEEYGRLFTANNCCKSNGFSHTWECKNNPDEKDPWCNSGQGRFEYKYDNKGTFNPILQLCLEYGGALCGIFEDKTVTVVVE